MTNIRYSAWVHPVFDFTYATRSDPQIFYASARITAFCQLPNRAFFYIDRQMAELHVFFNYH